MPERSDEIPHSHPHPHSHSHSHSHPSSSFLILPHPHPLVYVPVTMRIPLKRFLGISTRLLAAENPIKTLFWDSHLPDYTLLYLRSISTATASPQTYRIGRSPWHSPAAAASNPPTPPAAAASNPAPVSLRGHPGGELFGRLCPDLEKQSATECCQRRMPHPGRELFRSFCPYLAVLTISSRPGRSRDLFQFWPSSQFLPDPRRTYLSTRLSCTVRAKSWDGVSILYSQYIPPRRPFSFM